MRESIRVLAIDDDAADVRLLGRLLADCEAWDAELDAFEDGLAGLQELVLDPPDVLILDYRVGSRTGLEILRSARESGYEGPVIVLTGQGDEEIAVEVLQAGAADYLCKASLTREALERSITNSLEKSILRRTIERHREELATANRDLKRRNSEIRKFYQGLSHELKTPLTVMREFVSIVRDGLAGDVTGAQKEHLGLALEACDQMTMHVNDLLDLTRLETGKLVIDPRPVPLAEVLSGAVAALRPLVEKGGGRLKLELAADLPDVFVDEARIHQVIANLVRNAVKFSPADGEIVVRGERASAELAEISVRDQGVGIPERDHSRIFERLFQSGDGEAARKGGIGLGLPLCRELVKLHGGRIRVISAPGEGSIFRFTVPVHATPAARPASGSPAKETVR